MHTLQRYPDEAPPDAHTEELRREVLEGPPSLDSWNLVAAGTWAACWFC